jgi:hypothetical protein
MISAAANEGGNNRASIRAHNCFVGCGRHVT